MPKINSRKALANYEPKRRNPITLGDDSNIDNNLKPIKINGKNSLLELSDTQIDIKGDLSVNGSSVITESNDIDSLNDLSDVTYSSGDLTIDSIDKIIVSGDLTVDVDGGNFDVTDDGSIHFQLDCDNTRLRIFDDADANDHLTIEVGANGASTISTADNDGSAGHLALAPNGNILLTPSAGSMRFYDSDNSADYVDFDVDANGGLTIETTDTDGANANIVLDPDGAVILESNGGAYIKEVADAAGDSAAYGQVWVHNTTPNELCFTDDAGTDIVGIGKYHYETKFIGYYAGQTTSYIPMTGYTIERTSLTGFNENCAFIAPFNGTIEKFAFRSEIAQDGTFRLVVLESSDNTEVPGSVVHRFDETIDIADDTYHEYDLSSPSIGTAYGPLTKGKIYAFEFTTVASTFDTNITIVFKWDITS